MIVPDKSSLPLKAKDQFISLNQSQVDLFYKAFRQTKNLGIPPTFPAIALKGVFEIINDLKVDWKKLLHATQQFHYFEALKVPSQLKAEARLVDCKLRAGMYWLQFVVDVNEVSSGNKILESKSLIMVRAE